MAYESKQIRDFQIDFLQFLSDKPFKEVHIYHYIMNYWGNNSSSIVSLQVLKDAITDLCEKKYITSKSNAHLSLGVNAVSEEDQKNNAICIIEDEGRAYLKKIESARTIRNVVISIAVAAVIYLLWHFRHNMKYFFKQ
ncbi:MAG TPA: hypothetical protein VMT76_17310 [Puia sp.]|nr:hypothetical protein [Puia sp.]